ncbi:hypothetical protein WME95_06490 [Sorangium sp. So ce327]|uniref:hypothetical protein n=1 Tax=Sorangium sp. So ce327 TaxID=3133301 RepID=UPI003F5F6741
MLDRRRAERRLPLPVSIPVTRGQHAESVVTLVDRLVHSARNGWKVIPARCAPTRKPRSALQLAREMIAAPDRADRL